MNSMGHLVLSAIKSAFRIVACIVCLWQKDVHYLAAGFLMAELLGVAEELVDNR